MEEHWSALSNCRKFPEADFFPQPEDSASVAEALAICGNCKVQNQCLAYAIRNNVEFGIWGGKTEQQRRRITDDHMNKVRRRESTCRFCGRVAAKVDGRWVCQSCGTDWLAIFA